jgi:hypothetical protein
MRITETAKPARPDGGGPRKARKPIHISVYDGRRLLGHLIDDGKKKWRATDAHGYVLGNFRSRNAAAEAISAAVPVEASIEDPDNEKGRRPW